MKRAILNFMVMAAAVLVMASCGQNSGRAVEKAEGEKAEQTANGPESSLR